MGAVEVAPEFSLENRQQRKREEGRHGVSESAGTSAQHAREPLHRHSDHQRHAYLLKMALTIPAREDCISPLVESVLAAGRETNIDEAKEMEIETALREALANAIKHGCCGDRSKFVECGVAFEEDGAVLIIVSDPGKGFNPENVPDPTEGEHLFDNHGRGIYLINRMMDEVKFEKNGTEIHMRKY